jgi:hypothetical protein
VAYPVCTLLASGDSGAGALSCLLDTHFTVQVARDSCGWSFQFTEKHHHVARQIITALVFVRSDIYQN